MRRGERRRTSGKVSGRWRLLWAALPAALCLPGISTAWVCRVSAPALRGLNRLTARTPVSVAAVALIAALASGLWGAMAAVATRGKGRAPASSRRESPGLPGVNRASALPPHPRRGRRIGVARRLPGRGLRPAPFARAGHSGGSPALLRKAAGAVRRGLAGWIAAAYALLWLPALAASAPPTLPEPGPEALEALCAALIGALNDAPPEACDASECLARAPAVAGLSGGAVKPAAFPRGMRWLRAAGRAVPWTGEALVDAGAPPELLPFIAVHELMHLSGVGDEGAANIAAWQRCAAEGGAFAASARLWALRYAAGMLYRADAARCRRALSGMGGQLRAVWPGLGGVLVPPRRHPAGNYHALVAWLAAGQAR